MNQMGIAVVGLGMAVTPHAQSLRDLSDRARVVGAFSRSEERRHAFAERFAMPVTDDLAGLLRDPAVDLVMLLTPPNTHLDLVREASAAGKHVLLEKPLEVSPERAEALVRTARGAGIRLGIVLQHRFRPPVLKLKERLAEGGLGRLVSASASIRNWRPQAYYDEPGRGTMARDGGGVLITQGIHTLDLLCHIAGSPDEVSAYAATSPVHRMETEDLATAALHFPGGALGTIFATTAAYPGLPEKLDFLYEHGSASIEGGNLSIARHDGTEEIFQGEETGGAGADPMAFSNAQHRAVLADMLDAIREGRDPAITGDEALQAHRLIEAVLESARERRPVRV